MPTSSSKMVPFPSSGDFSTKAEFEGWLEEVKIGKTRSFCYVSPQLFGEITGKSSSPGVQCSDDEVRQMNVELGTETFQKENLLFSDQVNCAGCSRKLNFYDVFKKGMRTHGKEFLTWASTGRNKFVGVPEGTKQRIRCSDCGQENEASVGYATDVMSYNYYV